MLTPSRSNPSIYHQTTTPTTPIPVSLPRVPSDTPMVQTYDREPGVLRPRKQSWHSTMTPEQSRTDFTQPSTPFQRGFIPVYNPNPELQHAFAHSPTSSRTHISTPGRPAVPPPRRPEPSRSLVDLYQQSGSRNYDATSSALETSM